MPCASGAEACAISAAGLVEFRNAVQSVFAVELPATATFDHPTPAALAEFIAAQMDPAQQNKELALLGRAGRAHDQHSMDQQSATTAIVGWAASVAGPGTPHTCELSI